MELTKDYQKTNDILVNDEKLNLYTAEELNNKTFWETGPKKFFRRLNEILHSTNSDETFYLLYQGNDLATFLLTKNQYEIIKKKYINQPKEIPYLP